MRGCGSPRLRGTIRVCRFPGSMPGVRSDRVPYGLAGSGSGGKTGKAEQNQPITCIPEQLSVPVVVLKERPMSENGPRDADDWIAERSCCDQFAVMLRFRIATNPVVTTGSIPGSWAPVPLQISPCE